MATQQISHRVGLGGRNVPTDVAIVQSLLNGWSGTQYKTPVNGLMSPGLLSRIEEFQKIRFLTTSSDQRVDPHGRTFKALVEASRNSPQPNPFSLPASDVVWSRLKVETFAALHRLELKSSPTGLSTLLERLISDPDVIDVRWACYMLATVKHETANTFQPIEEFGKGKGKEYGAPVEYKDKNSKVYSHVYYGRGYVQLTWMDKYLNVGKAIGHGDELVVDPTLAMNEEIAYQIMSYGMRSGAFTTRKHKLEDYIGRTNCDYVHARRIINGLDKAHLVAEHATTFERLIALAIA